MPAEHAILGLLALGDRGGHGYDLARQFEEREPLGSVLRLEPGMLYHHLKKLAKRGWVAATVEQQGPRPPRQVYHLTEEGRAELMRWLREPVGRTREIRLEFLVKLFFARRIDPAIAATLVAEQRDTLARLAESLRLQRAASPPEGDDERAFTGLVLDLRIAQTDAALGWLDRLSAEGGAADETGRGQG